MAAMKKRNELIENLKPLSDVSASQLLTLGEIQNYEHLLAARG